MTNLDCTAIREFRRFAVSHIYPGNMNIITDNIGILLNGTDITFGRLPQPMIKFNCQVDENLNHSAFIEKLHIGLKGIFISYFNNEEIIKLFRNKIYHNINHEELKNILNATLYQIQIGNMQYVSLLFNITVLGDNVYVYL